MRAMQTYTLRDYTDPVMRIEIDAVLAHYDVESIVSVVVGATVVWFKVHDLDENGRPQKNVKGEIAMKTVKRKKVH